MDGTADPPGALIRVSRLGRRAGHVGRGADSWRFRGRWGWCNSEWDPRHAGWLHALRTGQARFFNLAEAMTRHSLDVDTCHYHPLRPYWVGGCYRHSMDHFGDEPCASHTFIDNWIDFYYLTGDGRHSKSSERQALFFSLIAGQKIPAIALACVQSPTCCAASSTSTR